MPETKRRPRSKNEGAEDSPAADGRAAPRKKKVEKDGASYGSYSSGGVAGSYRRLTDGGDAPPRRSEGAKAGTRAPRRRDEQSSEERPPRRFEGAKAGTRAPRRRDEQGTEERPPRRFEGAKAETRAPRRRDEQGTEERPPRRFESAKAGTRAPRAGQIRRPAPGRGPAAGTAAKPSLDSARALGAMVNRSLPEAAKRLNQARDCIFQAAARLLGLTEALSENQARMDGLLAELAAEERIQETAGGLRLSKTVESLHRYNRDNRPLLVQCFESLSFQDLAGQRLNKVLEVLAGLEELLAEMAGEKPRRKPEQPRPKRPRAAGGLKGPQGPGDGLNQVAIDRMLERQ